MENLILSNQHHQNRKVPEDPKQRSQYFSKYIQDSLTPQTKSKLLEAIKKDDAKLFIQRLGRASLTENLKGQNEIFTNFHAAAQFNSYKIMKALVELVFKERKAECLDILNLPNKVGNTPALICALNDSNETAFMLFACNLVDINFKNNAGEDFCCFTVFPRNALPAQEARNR